MQQNDVMIGAIIKRGEEKQKKKKILKTLRPHDREKVKWTDRLLREIQVRVKISCKIYGIFFFEIVTSFFPFFQYIDSSTWKIDISTWDQGFQRIKYLDKNDFYLAFVANRSPSRNIALWCTPFHSREKLHFYIWYLIPFFFLLGTTTT